jgi:hypothetical protein
MPLDRNVVLSTDGIFLHGVFLSAVCLTIQHVNPMRKTNLSILCSALITAIVYTAPVDRGNTTSKTVELT